MHDCCYARFFYYLISFLKKEHLLCCVYCKLELIFLYVTQTKVVLTTNKQSKGAGWCLASQVFWTQGFFFRNKEQLLWQLLSLLWLQYFFVRAEFSHMVPHAELQSLEGIQMPIAKHILVVCVTCKNDMWSATHGSTCMYGKKWAVLASNLVSIGGYLIAVPLLSHAFLLLL